MHSVRVRMYISILDSVGQNKLNRDSSKSEQFFGAVHHISMAGTKNIQEHRKSIDWEYVTSGS